MRETIDTTNESELWKQRVAKEEKRAVEQITAINKKFKDPNAPEDAVIPPSPLPMPPKRDGEAMYKQMYGSPAATVYGTRMPDYMRKGLGPGRVPNT